jgi:hypothetical protein
MPILVDEFEIPFYGTGIPNPPFGVPLSPEGEFASYVHTGGEMRHYAGSSGKEMRSVSAIPEAAPSWVVGYRTAMESVIGRAPDFQRHFRRPPF